MKDNKLRQELEELFSGWGMDIVISDVSDSRKLVEVYCNGKKLKEVLLEKEWYAGKRWWMVYSIIDDSLDRALRRAMWKAE